jgi:BirA family transcriptional regulator, biotin operon repressor / biotin---[acetyl-CoA-carboxylase] ligase
MEILARLRAARGEYMPLRGLGPDLEYVHEALDALASFGFSIERHPYRGAAYAGPAERLCPDQIEYLLNTNWIGRRVTVWNRVTSTNDLAARAGASVSNDGLVVLAEEQTAGRGRRGRTWTSPARSSILMSVLLFPPPHLAPRAPESALGCAWLTALGAVATCEVVAAVTGQAATIKWPNDVRVKGRKIAGILVERALAPPAPTFESPRGPSSDPTARGVVIGIGLNVNIERNVLPAELDAGITSLLIECGTPCDRSELVRDLIRRLDHWYNAGRVGGPDTLNAPWCALFEHLGTIVRIATPAQTVAGRLVDLDLERGVTIAVEPTPLEHGEPPELAHVPLADILDLQPTR